MTIYRSSSSSSSSEEEVLHAWSCNKQTRHQDRAWLIYSLDWSGSLNHGATTHAVIVPDVASVTVVAWWWAW